MRWFPRLTGWFKAEDNLPLQIRLFRLICAATAFLCLGVILPVNAFLNLPITVKAAVFGLGLFAVYCFIASRRHRHHSTLFLVVVMGLLNPIWFLNAGSEGSINYYFLVLGLYPIAIFRGRRRWIFSVLLGLNFFGLHLLEHFVPQLTIPYQRPMDRLLDQLSGAFDSFLALSLIAWLIVNSHDREQRRLAASENKLRESKEHLAEVLHVAAEGIAVQTPAGVVIECNQAAEGILGLDRDQVLGRRPVDFIQHATHPDGRPFLPEEFPLSVAVQTGEAQRGVEMMISTPGDRRPTTHLLINNEPIRDEAGAVRMVVTSFNDITERKQAEADRLVLSKLESTGILAGGIAHDYNNLLTAMLLNLDLAETDSGSPDELRAYLRAARHAGLTATTLTQQLITFAEGGNPVRKSADLERILRDAARHSLNGSPVTEQFAIAPELWSAVVDAGQIGQVLRNLITNAREAMPDGGKVTFVLENVEWSAADGSALSPGDYLRLSIIDEGVGIPPEIQPKIFDPYFSTKARGVQKGMGLGLTICRSVVLKHGGTIAVESVHGKGTTVRVSLPAIRQQMPASPPLSPALDGIRNTKILIMDDDEGIRNIVGIVARRMGCAVALASRGEEAVQQYREARAAGAPFDLVILDLVVRDGMGGVQALRALRELDSAVKALVMSGYANEVPLQHYASHGFNGALQKPFDTAVLQSAISRALGD